MSNMSYCRFENTLLDLGDCADHVLDRLTGNYEPDARVGLIMTCISILEKLNFAVMDNENVNYDVTEDTVRQRLAEIANNEPEEE